MINHKVTRVVIQVEGIKVVVVNNIQGVLRDVLVAGVVQLLVGQLNKVVKETLGNT